MAAALRRLFRSGEAKSDPLTPAARGKSQTVGNHLNNHNNNNNHNINTAHGQSKDTCATMASSNGLEFRNTRGQNTLNPGLGAWGESDLVAGDLGAVAGGMSSGTNNPPIGTPPGISRKFFSRHTYLDGSKVSPVSSQVSPKPQHKDPALKDSSKTGQLKPVKNGYLSETTAKHMKLVRSRRLMKEYEELKRRQMSLKEPIFTVELVNDCLYEWKVKLVQVDQESELYTDMQELGIHHILLSITFPDNFPFHPPFLRVLSPHLEKGFVMEGGAICMELLTPRGWASAYTIEAVIMQFAASLVKGQGRICRKSKSTSKDFNRKSAESAFRSLVKTHDKYGWVTPPLAEG